jgi:hypothetical protein
MSMFNCKRRFDSTELGPSSGVLDIVMASPMGLFIIALILSGFSPASAQDVRQGKQATVELSQPQHKNGTQTAVRGPAFTASVDELTLESDFTTFMRNDCPEDIRLQAMRRLWTLMPREPFEESSAI